MPYPRTLFVTTGQRFDRGVVIEADLRLLPTLSGGKLGKRGALLRCDCGAVYAAPLANLFREVSPTRSCGCWTRERSRQQMLTRHRTTAARER